MSDEEIRDRLRSMTNPPKPVATPSAPPTDKAVEDAIINICSGRDRQSAFCRLSYLGVEKVVIDYDGHGDSGSIDYAWFVFGSGATVRFVGDEADMELLYQFLQPGFEIDDGCHGTVTFLISRTEVRVIDEQNIRHRTTIRNEHCESFSLTEEENAPT